MEEVERRNPHEVNVRWLRVVIVVGVVFLLVSLVIYEDPVPGSGLLGPLDPSIVRRKIWFERLHGPDWAAMFNGIAAVSYLLPAFALQGRVRWRGVIGVVLVTATLAAVGIALLVHLMVTDPESFPIGNAGMARILLGHAIAGGGVAVMWLQLRQAAKT